MLPISSPLFFTNGLRFRTPIFLLNGINKIEEPILLKPLFCYIPENNFIRYQPHSDYRLYASLQTFANLQAAILAFQES